MDNKQLWLKYAETLRSYAASAFDKDKQTFSIAPDNLSVDIGNSNPEITNGYIYDIGNIVPANSLSYIPESYLASSYSIFLDSIDLKGDPNPNLDNLIDDAAAELSESQDNFGNVQDKAIEKYNKYKKIDDSITFDNYVKENYPVYIDARTDLVGKRSNWYSLMTQKYGEGFQVLKSAIDKVNPTDGALNSTRSNSYNMVCEVGTIAPHGSKPSLPGGTTEKPKEELKTIYYPFYGLEGFTTKYKEWQNDSVHHKIACKFTITSSSKTSNMSEFGFDASAKLNLSKPFFSYSLSGSAKSEFKELKCDLQSEDFSIEISYTGLGTFNIRPGVWFDQGIVKTYHNSIKADSPDFFGPEGSLARRPYAIVVGFEPHVKLTLNSSNYSMFKSNFQANATACFKIGPFKIGQGDLSTYVKKENVHYDDSSNTIEILPSKTTMPVLLGVVSAKM